MSGEGRMRERDRERRMVMHTNMKVIVSNRPTAEVAQNILVVSVIGGDCHNSLTIHLLGLSLPWPLEGFSISNCIVPRRPNL